MFYAKTITAADVGKRLSLTNDDFGAHKFAYYKYLREHEPVHRGKMMMMTIYLLSRYEDCVSMLKDPRFVRDRSTATGGRRLPFPVPKSVAALTTSMINVDEPEHRRLRNLVHRAFTRRRLAALEQRIEALTCELLDALEPRGEVDLMSTYAHPIPVTVIAEMVGVEVAEVPEMARYIEALTKGFSGLKMVRTLAWDLPRAAGFIRELIERKRADPGEDILSGLIEAEEEGEKLSEDELVAMVFLLIVAGHETTYGLITNAVYTLLRHPEQLARLRADPSLMDSAIEEILRYNGPIHGTKFGHPLEDVTLHGVTIPKGAMVMPLLGAGNHDPDAFEHPERFDIGRTPNKHLSFGQGIHYCLGAPLARMETKIALRALLDRNPNLRLAVNPEQIETLARPGWHMYAGLPVVLG